VGTTAGAVGTTAGAVGTTAGAAGAAGAMVAAGGSGGAADVAGVPLDTIVGTMGPADPPGVGTWLDGASNILKIQGAMFPFADTTSIMGMMADFTTAGKSCISGTAAKVDVLSAPCMTMMFTAPATDCYGQFWGAAVGLNLNQPTDPITNMGLAALPYDASALKGFSFVIDGAMVPGPTALRFKVEDAAGVEYCTPPTKMITATPAGVPVLFTDLQVKCYAPSPANLTADAVDPVTGKAAKSNLVKIGWAVVTNKTAAIPFNFCVSSLRALM
jgi:hypothetical protein